MPKASIYLNGDILRDLRKRLDLSQRKASILSRVSKRTYENAEAGKAVTENVAEKIAAALSTTVNRILAGPQQAPQAYSYYEYQAQRRRDLKLDVARIVASLVRDDPIVACSSGTTPALSVAEIVRSGHQCQVITNNVGAIDEAGTGDAKIEIAGGTYFYRIHACVGPNAVEAFKKVEFDVAIIGVSGIDEDGTCFVRHNEDIGVYDHIINSARRIIVAADISKLASSQVWKCPKIEWLNKEDDDRLLTVATNPLDQLANEPKLLKTASETIDGLSCLRRVNVRHEPVVDSRPSE